MDTNHKEPEKKLKIAIINHNVKDIGTYHRCFGFARNLANKGHLVYFFYLNPQRKTWLRKTKDNNLVAIELPWNSGGGVVGAVEHFFRGLYIFLYIATRKIDIVHSFNVPSPMVGFATFLIFLVKKIKKIKLVVDWDDIWGKGGLTELNKHKHGRIQAFVADFLETNIPLLADRLTLHNEYILHKAIKCRVRKEIITKIYNGANVEAFASFYERNYGKEDARNELGLQQDKLILFFGGAVVISVPFLLDVLSKINDKNVILIVVGPVNVDLLESAKIKELENRVFFKGRVSYDVFKKYLFASDILLLPRNKNNLLDVCTFPGRLGDFMLAGRPIIASDVGELSILFRQEKIGLLAKSGDAEDFKNNIIKLIENKELGKELSKSAINVGRERYNWSILTDILLEKVYND